MDAFASLDRITGLFGGAVFLACAKLTNHTLRNFYTNSRFYPFEIEPAPL